MGVGLWHVLCLRYKCLRIMCLSMRDVKKVVGFLEICPCMLCRKRCVKLKGNCSRVCMCGSFQIEHLSWYWGCHTGGAGCSKSEIPPAN